MHERMHILHASAVCAWSADRARALTCQNRSSASASMLPCPRVGVRATTSRDRPVMKSKQPGVDDAVPESSCETLHMILASLSLINHAHIATCDPSTSFKNFTEVENERTRVWRQEKQEPKTRPAISRLCMALIGLCALTQPDRHPQPTAPSRTSAKGFARPLFEGHFKFCPLLEKMEEGTVSKKEASSCHTSNTKLKEFDMTRMTNF